MLCLWFGFYYNIFNLKTLQMFVCTLLLIKRWQLAYKNGIRLPSKIGYQLDINIPVNYGTTRFLLKLEFVIEKLYLTDTSLILKLGFKHNKIVTIVVSYLPDIIITKLRILMTMYCQTSAILSYTQRFQR